MFRWYQQEAIDSLFEYFKTNTGNPLIAMPTGTGKSHIIGGFIQQALQYYPRQRFMCLTHVKELIEQNATKLYEMWPHAPIGIYSAGLNQRDSIMPIIFGGVQSVVNRLELFGYIDLLFIDEAHLLSPKEGTMYQKVIAYFKQKNPFLKVIGLTATPFRLGQGMITDGGLFTDIAYTMCDIEGFKKLLAEGWISPLIPKRTKVELDVRNVGIHNGEFAQQALQGAVDKREITFAALSEACELGKNRRSWLTFASGIEHAEHIAEMLTSFGIVSAAVHSKSTREFRDAAIRAHKDGSLRSLVGNNVFTTGFDNPSIDFIIDLQPTMSPGKHVQKCGRGTRPSPETHKVNCLVADYARNTQRLGCINDPMIPNKKGKGTGEVPVKICDSCGTYNHAKIRFCTNCGNEFDFKVKIVKTAGSDELLRSDIPLIDYFNVDKVIYNKHEKHSTGSISIKVTYLCNGGFHSFNEWISFDAQAKPMFKHKSHEWWKQRHHFEPPPNNELALQYMSYLKVPKRISVWVNTDYPKVINYEF